jgi:lipopolysaccharide export system protein LptA
MPPNVHSNIRALKYFASLSFVFLMACLPVAALAEKADRDKPMNIEADNLVHDELKQISIFTGRAVLTKGTLVLRGSRIEVNEDPDGYQFGVVFADGNKRAFYRQKREGLQEFMEGEAQRIEYDGREDRVTLIDQAEVRRYRGATLGDQMNGKRIVYNNLTDIFTIDGQPAADDKSSSKAANGRVRATLVPRSSNNETQDKK